MKKMTKPTSKITTPNTSPLYKLLIVCFLALLLVACDDDKDDNKPATDNKPTTYTVTFNTDGGTPATIDTQTVKSGDKAQEPDEKPTKADSVVIGWINTATGQPYDFSAPVRTNLALKAVYAKVYKVTFDTDDGTPNVDDQIIARGSQAQEPGEKPTKGDTLVLSHWETQDGTTYDFSQTVNANLNLKAVYAKVYKVTFDTDDGTPNVDDQIIARGSQAQEPGEKPTKGDTLVLSHWETQDGTTYDFSQTVNANLNLKAVYAKIYTVRFNINGGNTIDDKKVLDGEPVAAPMPPTKTDEFFAGWYADNMFTTPYNFKEPVTASITLYARWSDYNIPDDKFRAYLKGEVSNAFNGEQLQIDHQEVKALTTIDVAGQGIASLEGIQYFTGLTELQCYNNPLKSLDVSKNTALTTLWCSSNQLSSLDISKNTALETLLCYNNQLSSLDISKNTALETLLCSSNQLSSLDVSGATALTSLNCSSNQLSSLDVSGATALTSLNCSSNQLSSLDVSGATALTELICFSNQLISLDVSGATALKELRCNANKLSLLNMKANKNLTSLSIHFVGANGIVFPNDQLAEILAHEDILCLEGDSFASGIKGVFEANKETLEMTIKSYDDNGDETTYDEAAYAAACPNE